MKIINPLYDIAFKYLMQEERYAKKVLGVILETEVVSVALQQQESVYQDEKKQLRVFRLDFKATVRNSKGDISTVLIELQKSKFPTDIERFRNYLGLNYITPRKEKKEKETVGDEPVVSEPGPEYASIYPIITIYILGYKLQDLPHLAVKVNRDVIDSVSKKKIKSRSFFVEHVTHQSHIIQISRLPEKRRTRLEKFLSFFNQAWCSNYEYIIDLQEIPEGFEDIAGYLGEPTEDEQFRRNLELERQTEYAFYKQESRMQELEKLRKEEEQLRKEEEKRRKEEVKRRRKEENLRKEEENLRKASEEQAELYRKQKESAYAKLRDYAKMLKDSGMDTHEIAEKTGLSQKEIETL